MTADDKMVADGNRHRCSMILRGEQCDGRTGLVGWFCWEHVPSASELMNMPSDFDNDLWTHVVLKLHEPKTHAPYASFIESCFDSRRLRHLAGRISLNGSLMHSHLAVKLAEHHRMPPDALFRLAGCQTFSDDLQKALAQNPATPKTIIEGLSRHDDIVIRDAVAARPDVPWGMVRRLIADTLLLSLPEGLTARRLVIRPRLPYDIQHQLADLNWPPVWPHLAGNSHCDPDLLTELAATGEVDSSASGRFRVDSSGSRYHISAAQIRQRAAENPNTRPSTLTLLAFDGKEAVRRAAACSWQNRGDKCSTDAAHDRIVAICRQAKLEEADALHVLQHGCFAHRQDILEHPGVPPEALLHALQHPDQETAACAALSSQADRRVISQALLSDNPKIRKAAASNNNATIDQVEIALQDDHSEVRLCAVTQPCVSGRMLQRIRNDDDPDVRETVYRLLAERERRRDTYAAPSFVQTG